MVVCLAGSIAAMSGTPRPASAQTIGFADAVNQMAMACKTDISKYCKKVSLGGGRLAQCLTQSEMVSANCKSTLSALSQMVQKRAAARASVLKICDRDIDRLCSGVQQGDGNLMQCFFATRKNASAQCQQVVADAGYEVPIVADQPTTQIALDPGNIVPAPSSLSAATLRQLVQAGLRDPSRAERVNRPPLVDQLNNMAQITIAIAFDFNSARISPDSFKAVGLMADALNSPYLQAYRFLIIGNTDAVGRREYNLKLSQERADAIRAALINPFGISSARLEAVGLGEEQLLDPAHPDAAENRRVQLINIGR
jgi:outer membrane protein OmpA-like peptidoglycan-associated protein